MTISEREAKRLLVPWGQQGATLWRVQGEDSSESSGGTVTFYVVTAAPDRLPDVMAAFRELEGDDRRTLRMIEAITQTRRFRRNRYRVVADQRPPNQMTTARPAPLGKRRDRPASKLADLAQRDATFSGYSPPWKRSTTTGNLWAKIGGATAAVFCKGGCWRWSVHGGELRYSQKSFTSEADAYAAVATELATNAVPEVNHNTHVDLDAALDPSLAREVMK